MIAIDSDHFSLGVFTRKPEVIRLDTNTLVLELANDNEILALVGELAKTANEVGGPIYLVIEMDEISYPKREDPLLLPIIGRERMLCTKLTKLLQDAASRKHEYTAIRDHRRGASFDLDLLEDGEKANRKARVTIEMLPLEDQVADQVGDQVGELLRNTPVRPQEAPGAPEMEKTAADTTPSEMASEIQSEIDSGKEAARTIPQLVSAIRQNLAGAGADLHSLNLLVSRIEHAVTKEEYDRLLDVLASLKNHITKLDAKATLAKEDKDK